MNIFVEKLAEGTLPELDHHAQKLIVEDNIGEGVHIHIRDVRLEMSTDDFMEFSKEIENAAKVFRNGDY